MKTFLYLIFLLISNLSSFAQSPLYSIKAKGAVTSIILEGDKLYAANDKGSIECFNWKSKKLDFSIEFENIKDFMGDEMPPKVYSIDKIEGKSKLIGVSQGVHGFRNLHLIINNKLEKLLDAEKDKMMIKKAYFLNENQIIIATLGNEIMVYNIENKTWEYKKHIGTSVFSDFCINEDKSKLAATDESGIIHILNTQTGESIKEYSGQNVDNIYQLAFFAGKVIGAGQDRRICVYSNLSSYYLESSFLVYSVGMSRDGKWGAFADGEENDIKVFSISTKSEKIILKGQKSTLTQIKFVEENYIISSSEDPEIMVWKWR
ncbi:MULTISPECIES: WD40 repeat domain-containing protein [unclassified Lentimicrobium]|uniref:WD40 repeat domain-containing protein n=1 Tax=unclassified Lentimicrobium TaxID=2677434 RepID=UPI0015555572|nr:MULTISPECIES: WD40 repeat domain-containing protein [unclassified Lentimicrobium]NPD44970.1 WD40 repeat domain-containing protein [Lentimicrobium sp. S6]NPD83476.1 WD40 repeat domain-containing protein [Lentimicrobium sp. L6]